LALAAGNALASDALTAPERESLQQALQALTAHADPVVQEQVAWSLRSATRAQVMSPRT
jgi:epoxyqueuosine reductase